MVEVLLERFSAVVSDVCACLMGFKVRLDYFWRGSLIWGLTLSAPWAYNCIQVVKTFHEKINVNECSDVNRQKYQNKVGMLSSHITHTLDP